jgi:hypothetical protein
MLLTGLMLLLMIGIYLLFGLLTRFSERLIDRPAPSETLDGTGPADLGWPDFPPCAKRTWSSQPRHLPEE